MAIDILGALQGPESGDVAPTTPAAAPSGVNVLAALQAADEGSQGAPAPGPAPTPLQRFAQGMGDTFYGLGNLAQHAAGPALNLARRGISAGLSAAGAPNAAALFAPVSNQDFGQIVADRENAYDQARAAAGQNGIDWWRLAGNVANPVNYMAPEDIGATAAARIGQAALQGAGVGGAQAAGTVSNPADLWWDTAKGTALGGAMGGALSSAVEGAAPALRLAMNKARGLVSNGAMSSTEAADQVVKDALQANGTDPSTINLGLLKGLRSEVKNALDVGAAPSDVAIANRAKAESLPVPVYLMRGQATRDGMLFTREQELAKIGMNPGENDIGAPIRTLLKNQNSAFIQNLDALGAKNAPDPVSLGAQLSKGVQDLWDGLQARKSALYQAVRNSQGQSAAVDGVQAADQIKSTLDTPQASHVYDMLPAHIKRTIDELGSGQLPFSVAQMQSLDKIWGDAARGTDGSTAYAINQARRILADAPISGDVGEQARAAYLAARQAHAQQMSLVDPKLPNGQPNPNFQPIVKSVVMDGKPPEALFNQHFANAAPSVAAKNLQFLSQIDPNAPEAIGRTLMGEIKRQALGNAPDGAAVFGERGATKLRAWANDPVKSALMDALLPAKQVATFRNLSDVADAAYRPPVASYINRSNTASTLVNHGLSMLKNNALSQTLARFPILNSAVHGLGSAQTLSDVQSAVKPGVTLKSLLTATPSQAAKNRLLARLGTPFAVSLQQARGREQ